MGKSMRAFEPVRRCRDQAEEFACPHCKTGYVIIWDPARDNGSAHCEVCDNEMLRWQESFIPLIMVKI
jgi:transcription elongation factor Elf1